MALTPLPVRVRIKLAVVGTYGPVSGAAKGGMDELWHQTKGMYTPPAEKPPKQFT